MIRKEYYLALLETTETTETILILKIKKLVKSKHHELMFTSMPAIVYRSFTFCLITWPVFEVQKT